MENLWDNSLHLYSSYSKPCFELTLWRCILKDLWWLFNLKTVMCASYWDFLLVHIENASDATLALLWTRPKEFWNAEFKPCQINAHWKSLLKKFMALGILLVVSLLCGLFLHHFDHSLPDDTHHIADHVNFLVNCSFMHLKKNIQKELKHELPRLRSEMGQRTPGKREPPSLDWR